MTGRRERRWRRGGRAYPGLVAAAMLPFFLLLEYTFARYPASLQSTGTGPKANPPLWLGVGGARLLYTGMAIAFGLLYVCVADRGGRSDSTVPLGAAAGLAAGGLWLVVSAGSALFAALGWLRPLSALAVLALAVVAGGRAVGFTGYRGAGALSGFWTGLTVAAALAVWICAVDLLFAFRRRGRHGRQIRPVRCRRATA